jgi:hypothetical protein
MSDRILTGLKAWLDQPSPADPPLAALPQPFLDGPVNCLEPNQRVTKVICKCGQPFKLYIDGKYFCAACGDHALLVKGLVHLIDQQNRMVEMQLQGHHYHVVDRMVRDFTEVLAEFQGQLDVIEARLETLEKKGVKK